MAPVSWLIEGPESAGGSSQQVNPRSTRHLGVDVVRHLCKLRDSIAKQQQV